MDNITLEYKRVGEEYEGRVQKDGQILLGFDGLDFKTMFIMFSNILRDHDDHGAVLQRTDRPGLNPMSFNAREVKELKDDPEAVANALSAPARVVHVRDKITPNSSVKLRLRTGTSTMADAFGDRLYIRKRDGKIESPFTGRWIEPQRAELDLVEHNDKWSSVSTSELLDFCAERYFLPRLWNFRGPWIGHEVLKAKYNDYLKERENV